MFNLYPKYDVNLIIENGNHHYVIGDDSSYKPGVTTILDEMNKHLVPWAAKEVSNFIISILSKCKDLPDRDRIFDDHFLNTLLKRAKKQPQIIKDKSANFGTITHSIIDKIIKKTPYTRFKELETVLMSYDHFIETSGLKPICGDLKVGSKSLGYGGSLDAIFEDSSGNWTVVDFKTGSRIYETHAYQISAYIYALIEQYNIAPSTISGGMVIRLDKNKVSYQVGLIKDLKDCFTVFRCAFELYKARQIAAFEYTKTHTKKTKGVNNETIKTRK